MVIKPIRQFPESSDSGYMACIHPVVACISQRATAAVVGDLCVTVPGVELSCSIEFEDKHSFGLPLTYKEQWTCNGKVDLPFRL